jgi:hypothetical protein
MPSNKLIYALLFATIIGTAEAQNNPQEMAPPILADHWLNREGVPTIPAEDYLLFIYVNFTRADDYDTSLQQFVEGCPNLSLVNMILSPVIAPYLEHVISLPNTYSAIDYSYSTREVLKIKSRAVHAFLIAPDGNTLWRGLLSEVDTTEIKQLMGGYEYGKPLPDRIVTINRDNVPSRMYKPYHNNFSIRELRDRDSSAYRVKSFNTNFGFTAMTGALSGIVAVLLDIPPQQIDADGLIHNPVLEVKSLGLGMSNQLLLDLLKELYLLEIEKDADGTVVLKMVFPSDQD